MSVRTILPASMDTSLGYHVNRAAKAFTAALASRLPEGMTTTQVALLAHLVQHPGISQKEIASATGIDTATLAEMLRRLEARGHVRREQDPSDARRVLVSIGDLDPDLLAEALRSATEVNELAMTGLTDGERACLIPLLMCLAANLAADR